MNAPSLPGAGDESVAQWMGYHAKSGATPFCRLNPLKTYPLQQKSVAQQGLRNAHLAQRSTKNRTGWQILFTPAGWILPGECWKWDNRKTPRKLSFWQRSLI